MAICPVCHEEGEFCQECPKDHRHYIESTDLLKAGDDDLMGALVGGQYVPVALIGEGGMGKIYRARAKYTGKTVALKILKSEYMEDETLKARFFREAEVVASLDHPNIVKLYGCAPEPAFNTIFMAMELLVGRSMYEALKRDTPPFEVLLNWFVEIASALGEAHKHEIFHRDLKPENVFIMKDEDGVEHAKVLDFGFARLQNASKKLTMAGVAFGTPHYMSPEQAMGMTEITAAVDIYALGVMLFQMVSGHVPFDSAKNSPMEVMHAQVYEKTPACIPREGFNVPKRLIDCIYKCMNKEPKDRYPDGNALHAELVAIVDQMNAEKKAASSQAAQPKPMAHADHPSNKGNGGSDFAPIRLFNELSNTNKILLGVLIVLLIIVIVVFAIALS